MSDDKKTCLTDGSAVTPDHKEIDPKTGMQKGYVVLTQEERDKGFVRPYRDTYRHIGAIPTYPLRNLTEEEKERHDKSNYVKYEKYPEDESIVGRFWTQAQLNSGCRATTTMGRSLAETYARDPEFYGGTFCAVCGSHFPLEEFIWDGTDEKVGS